MSDFQNYVGRFETRHQELLDAAAVARKTRAPKEKRHIVWPLALATALERASAALRARYEQSPSRQTTRAASAWRMS